MLKQLQKISRSFFNSKFVNAFFITLLILIPILLGFTILVRFLSPFGLAVNYEFNIAENAELFGRIRDVERSASSEITQDKISIKDKFDVTKEKVEFSVLPISKDFKTMNFNIGIGNMATSSILVQMTNFKNRNTDNFVIANKELDSLGMFNYKFKDFYVWSFNQNLSSVDQLSSRIEALAQGGDSISTCTLGTSMYLEPVIEDIKALSTPKTYSQILRGSHIFNVYVGSDGILYFSVDKQDLNWYSGVDEATVKVSKKGNILRNEIITDDGIYDGKFGRPLGIEFKYKIEMNNLEEGVYEISFDTTEDVLLKNVSTRNSKFVIAKDIFIVNNQVYGIATSQTDLFTFAPRLFISSYHDSGSQSVILNGQKLSLEDVQDFESFELNQNILNQIGFSESNVRVSSKDYYSLDKESYFKPSVADEVNCLSFPKDVLVKQDILVLRNQSKILEDGSYSVEIPFSEDYIGPDSKIYFTLYSPGLRADQSKTEIESLNIDLIK